MKRESFGHAGGLQTPARPRHSADRRSTPPGWPANPAPSGYADSFCCADDRRPSVKSTAPRVKVTVV
jgi:hypothetical protein